ncbi:MAG: sensor histidine kinase [Myxococcota bacterium]
MSFKLKIFIFLFFIVSISMLVSYLYGIRVVEEDRRNFINEYIEHKAVNTGILISETVNQLSLLSNSLCLTNAEGKSERVEIEGLIKKFISENRYVLKFYFKKGNFIVKYNFDENLADPGEVTEFHIFDGDGIYKASSNGCQFFVNIDLRKMAEDFLEGNKEHILAIFVKDTYYLSRDIDGGIAEYRDAALRNSDKALSGVFSHKDFVCGYKFVKNGDILVLYLINRNIFESAIISLRYRILIAGFLILLFFLIIGFFIAGRITRPMVLLKEKAQLIKTGIFEKIGIAPTDDEIGEAVGAFNRMIDDLREKEENLKESQMKLVQAEKMSAFGQLSAGIAHEVKNPLTSVMGYIQLARRIVKDEKIAEYLGIAENETIRCKQIVEDLLKFARMDRHQKTTIDLSEVVRNTIKLINHQLMMKRIKLNYEDNNTPLFTYGNANQLQQVFLNILLNAMQSIERKGINDGFISVNCGREDNKMFVSIKDNGEGISKENIQKIFEPFFTTKADSGGTGLGLSISYGIIKEHNGEIKVNSVLGEGTEFKILLNAE